MKNLAELTVGEGGKVRGVQGGLSQRLRDLGFTRGAAVESIVPAVKDMDQVDFYELMEKVLTHPAVIPLLPGGNEDGTVPLPPDADQAQ